MLHVRFLICRVHVHTYTCAALISPSGQQSIKNKNRKCYKLRVALGKNPSTIHRSERVLATRLHLTVAHWIGFGVKAGIIPKIRDT